MGASDTGPEKHAQDHRSSQPITYFSRKLVLGKGDQTGGPAWGPFLKAHLRMTRRAASEARGEAWSLQGCGPVQAPRTEVRSVGQQLAGGP